MRSFQGRDTLDPVPGRVVNLLQRIDRAAGAEASYADQLPRLLESLRERARVESVTASNAIEGVVVDDARVPRLISGRAGRFRDRSEAEFAGYSAALDYLNESDSRELNIGLILHIHRLMYSFTEGRGGQFKTEDNLVVDRHPDGTRTVRFEPVSASKTPFFMTELVARTVQAMDRREHHPLIVIAASVLDLSCIHPFSDGNGRVARLLTNYLLGRAGYRVALYVSLEQLIFETKDGYYAALAASTDNWFDGGQHEIWPWCIYLFDRLDEAYARFGARTSAGTSGGSKQDRVRDYILLHSPKSFSIADVRRAVPGVSDNTIRLVLATLKDASEISNDGTGRTATWHRN